MAAGNGKIDLENCPENALTYPATGFILVSNQSPLTLAARKLPCPYAMQWSSLPF